MGVSRLRCNGIVHYNAIQYEVLEEYIQVNSGKPLRVLAQVLTCPSLRLFISSVSGSASSSYHQLRRRDPV
jgi:hypothetical protein